MCAMSWRHNEYDYRQFLIEDYTNRQHAAQQGVCRDCGSDKLVEDWSCGDLTCRDCGLVAESSMMAEAPEWVNNNVDEKGIGANSRVGAPENHLYNNMMSTTVSFRGRTKPEHWRMAQLHQRQSMDYKDRSLHKMYMEMERIAESTLQLPADIVNGAKELYKDLKESRITRGDNHKALVACCVYYACKLHRHARREKVEIFEAFGIERSVFTHACKMFQDMVRGKTYYDALFGGNDSDRGIISRTVGLLYAQLDAKKIDRFRFVRKVEDKYALLKDKSDGSLDSKTPHSLITALIFIVSEEMNVGITKNDVKTCCNVSAVTLSKTITLVKQVLGTS